MKIIVYENNKPKEKELNIDLVLDLFYLKYKVKEKDQKEILSSYIELIPVFDIKENNIYVIDKEDIEQSIRDTKLNYRVPDKNILEYINEEIENNQFHYERLKSALAFINNYDIDILQESVNKIYKNDEYTTIFRPSYIRYYKHLMPYYTKSEYDLLGDYEIDRNILIDHLDYLYKTNSISMVQIYSFFESYIMNRYMRTKPSRDQYLEKNIRMLYNIIKKAPIIEEEIILYRFLHDDSFLTDEFIEEGFMSTTRDPFYKSPYYSLGNKLMKIRIKKGHVLFMELISYFYREKEVLILPGTKFKLIKKGLEVDYNHIDPNVEILNKYEYEAVGIGKTLDEILQQTKFETKEERDIKEIDFEEKIDINRFMEKYVNKFRANIANKSFIFNIDKVRLSTPYTINSYYDPDPKYEGIIIYLIHEGQIMLTMQIGEKDMSVNSNNRKTFKTKFLSEIVDIEDIYKFINKINDLFNLNKNIVYKNEYKMCNIKENNKIIKISTYNYDEYKLFKEIRDNKKEKISNYYFDKKEYLLLKKKYYLNIFDLFEEYYSKNISDGLYYLFYEFYSKKYESKNLGDLFIWLCENKCYLANDLEHIFIKLFS